MQTKFGVWLPVATLLAVSPLAGCAGVDAIANHGNLDVHTHMSETIFLDPVPARMKTIYIGMRNTSDFPSIDVRGPLMNALQARGYTIVNDPNSAHYLLQGNVLQAGKLEKGQINSLLGSGYGGPLLAGAVAGGLTAGFGGNTNTSLGVGLGVAAATALVNYAFQDVTYAVTVDLQLSERPIKGGVVRQTTVTSRVTGSNSSTVALTDSTAQTRGYSVSGSSNSNGRTQVHEGTSDFLKYNVRDIAYADKVNLKPDEAIPPLVEHLTSAFANLFE